MIAKMLRAGGTFNKDELRTRVNEDLARIQGPGWKNVLQSSASWAKHYSCENWGELSALAFVHLRDMSIRPFDWVQVNHSKHAFVVAGRDSGGHPSDYTTWGRSSLLLRPSLGDYGEAAVLHVRYWRKKMESLYRLDSFHPVW